MDSSRGAQKTVSAYSAAMIGEHVIDRHSDARDKFRQEAQVVSSYLKTLHPHRKDGHLQLNYPSTIRRLNQNESAANSIVPMRKSEPHMSFNTSSPARGNTETGITSLLQFIAYIGNYVGPSDQAEGAHGEYESVHFS